MFKLIKPQWAEDPDRQLSWMSLSEEFMRFEKQGRVLLVPSELGVAPDGQYISILSLPARVAWQPPHEAETLSDAQLRTIRAEITEAAESLGMRFRFEPEGTSSD